MTQCINASIGGIKSNTIFMEKKQRDNHSSQRAEPNDPRYVNWDISGFEYPIDFDKMDRLLAIIKSKKKPDSTDK